MKSVIISMFLCCAVHFYSIGQTDSTHKKDIKPKIIAFDRIFWLGTDFKGHAMLYMDGPRMLFKINSKMKLGPTFFPTLFYNFNTKEFNTTLGAGLRFDYKRIAIGVPVYKIDGQWRLAYGIGYKF